MNRSLSFRVTERLLVILSALLATYAFFYEYLPPFKRVHIFSDIEGYHYPLQRYAFLSLKMGRLPQWDPSIYCGISFAGNVQAALWYPPSWLMYAACWNRAVLPFKALEFFAFAHVALGAVLCYFWLRGRRMDVLPCVLGAAVFAYGGYMVSQLVHLGVVTGLAWMPLGLMGVDQSAECRDWRPLWKTTLAAALCFLAGYPPSWVVFCATIFLYALAGPGNWRSAVRVLLALAASAVLGAVQWIPALEARSQMAYGLKYGNGVHRWQDFLPYFVPNWFDFNRRTSTPYPDEAFYVYLGLAGIFAIGWALQSRTLRAYFQPLVPTIFGLVMAGNPLYLVSRVIRQVPLLAASTQTYNFFEGVAAMAALVTAMAIHDFLSRPGKAAPKWEVFAVAGVLPAWCVYQVIHWQHGGTFPTGGRALLQTAISVVLFSLAMWIVRGEHDRRRALLVGIILLTVGVDYKVFGTNRRFNTADGDVDRDEAARSIPGMNGTAFGALYANRNYRVVLDENGSPYSTDLRKYGLATPQGFDPFLPARYRDAVERKVTFRTDRLFFPDPLDESLLRFFGVRFVITRQGAAHEALLRKSPDFERIGPDDSYYRVYEYRSATPPYGFENGSGSAIPTEWTPERRVLQVTSSSGGRFYLIEQFYAGWSASVDGRPVPIERWQDTFQAIRLTPGAHIVSLVYRERFLVPAAALSLIGIAALLFVMKSNRNRRIPGEEFRVDLRFVFRAGLRITKTGRSASATS